MPESIGTLLNINMGAWTGGALKWTVVIIVGVLWLGLMAGLIYYFRNYKQYKQYRVIIYEKDALGKTTMDYDDAGVFTSWKSGLKLLWLKKYNVGLNPDQIPYSVDGKGNKIVQLLRKGLKDYSYIRPIIHNPSVQFAVGESDLNWYIAEREAYKRRFGQNTLMQILPYVALILVTMVILIMIIQVLKHFDVIRDAAVALKEAANILAMNPNTAPTVP